MVWFQTEEMREVVNDTILENQVAIKFEGNSELAKLDAHHVEIRLVYGENKKCRFVCQYDIKHTHTTTFRHTFRESDADQITQSIPSTGEVTFELKRSNYLYWKTVDTTQLELSGLKSSATHQARRTLEGVRFNVAVCLRHAVDRKEVRL